MTKKERTKGLKYALKTYFTFCLADPEFEELRDPEEFSKTIYLEIGDLVAEVTAELEEEWNAATAMAESLKAGEEGESSISSPAA